MTNAFHSSVTRNMSLLRVMCNDTAHIQYILVANIFSVKLVDAGRRIVLTKLDVLAKQ